MSFQDDHRSDKFLTVKTLAKRLVLSEKTIRNLLGARKIHGYRIGREWRIDEEELEAYLARQRAGGDLPGHALESERNVTMGSDPETAPQRLAQLEALKTDLAWVGDVVLPTYEHMERAGILDVLAPRGESVVTRDEISRVLSLATGIVWLQGISLKEFFGDHQYTDIIRRLFGPDSLFDDSNPLDVRVILQHPDSAMARARAVLENGWEFSDEESYQDSVLYQDITRSLKFLDRLKHRISSGGRAGLSLHYCLVDFMPPQYAVMTDEVCFMEPYYLGKIMYMNTPGDCIGRRVEMFRMRPDSAHYQSLRSQMEYFWDNENPHLKIVRCEDHPASRAKMAGGETLQEKTRLLQGKQLIA